jgi:hypothetical protein
MGDRGEREGRKMRKEREGKWGEEKMRGGRENGMEGEKPEPSIFTKCLLFCLGCAECNTKQTQLIV